MAEKLPTLGSLDFGHEAINLDYYLKSAYDDISQASQELPAIIEWVNEQLQPYVEEKLRLKQNIRETEARVYFELLDGAFEELYHGKKTSAAIERAVALDSRVNDLYERMARVVGWVARLQSLQDSLAAKLDLVRSSESTRRRVSDGDNNQN